MFSRQSLDRSASAVKCGSSESRDVYDILREGSKVAEAKAAETLKDVKASMRINYFDDDNLIH